MTALLQINCISCRTLRWQLFFPPFINPIWKKKNPKSGPASWDQPQIHLQTGILIQMSAAFSLSFNTATNAGCPIYNSIFVSFHCRKNTRPLCSASWKSTTCSKVSRPRFDAYLTSFTVTSEGLFKNKKRYWCESKSVRIDNGERVTIIFPLISAARISMCRILRVNRIKWFLCIYAGGIPNQAFSFFPSLKRASEWAWPSQRMRLLSLQKGPKVLHHLLLSCFSSPQHQSTKKTQKTICPFDWSELFLFFI